MHTFCQKGSLISVSKPSHNGLHGDKLTATKTYDDFKAIIIFSGIFWNFLNFLWAETEYMMLCEGGRWASGRDWIVAVPLPYLTDKRAVIDKKGKPCGRRKIDEIGRKVY